jgi:hypothetical protein
MTDARMPESASSNADVGHAADAAQQLALAVEAVHQASLVAQRVGPSGGLLAAHQHLVGRLEVQDP